MIYYTIARQRGHHHLQPHGGGEDAGRLGGGKRTLLTRHYVMRYACNNHITTQGGYVSYTHTWDMPTIVDGSSSFSGSTYWNQLHPDNHCSAPYHVGPPRFGSRLRCPSMVSGERTCKPRCALDLTCIVRVRRFFGTVWWMRRESREQFSLRVFGGSCGGGFWNPSLPMAPLQSYTTPYSLRYEPPAQPHRLIWSINYW